MSQKLWRMDNRAFIYTAVLLLAVVLVIVFALRDNRQEVDADHSHEYPVAYSAVSGSDAEVSPSDVAERADSYLAQFREFDRTYCFEYWMQCQNILAEDPDYAPDEELTSQAREDYDRYVLVVRTEREENRAFMEKLVVCAAVGFCGVVAAALLGINRLRRFLLSQRADGNGEYYDEYAEEYAGEYTDDTDADR